MEDLMKKKNIGAMLSVIAAVTAGASAYATTIDNLDQDQHTNSLISEANYTDTYTNYDLVKSEYTNEVKNTKIAQEAKPVESKEDKKADLDKLVEEAARDTVIEVKAAKIADENKKDVADEKAVESEAKEEVNDLPVVKYVNTPLLNIRSSKEITDNNIVSSLKAGDKVVGKLEDGFLSTEEGYISEGYLSDYYPEDLVNELNTKEEAKASQEAQVADEANNAKEQNAAEEAKKAQEAKAAEEAKKAQEAKVAEEAKKAQEAKAAEEAKKAQEAKAAEQAKEEQTYYYTGWVNTTVLNVRNKANNGSIIGSVRKGDRLEGQVSNGWLEINYNGQKGYVSTGYMSDTEVAKEEVKEAPKKEEKAPQQQEEAVKEVEDVEEASYQQAPAKNGSGLNAAGLATQFVGSPYVWGEANPNVGFDCSGLTSYVYRQMGISIPHQSAAQYSCGYAVNSSNLQAGDLVFFSFGGGGIDHVGIVVNSDGTFVHASTPATGVKYDNVYNGSFQNAFVGARRIY
ncbi:NlpC/P60 family protein [Anaerococcus tetradius ATCC 35098]|uniref:NlpC/P60 family protein n=3 Tax=Anaerococcus tetradius TaxID=33036 RepID=C2CG95_9FIRM|nr:NlpC/P60 family protein [Anaerococcus tetradius ATCC 35098]KWZ78969.1 NlpC/P60 family protein [Anaerococcus tetradius]